MRDFFTRRQTKAKEGRIYFFEGCPELYCETLPSIMKHKHSVKWTDKDGTVYRTEKTKGGRLAESLLNYGSYRLLRFDIVKESSGNKEIVGKISFPKSMCVSFTAETDSYFLQCLGEGYYSLIKNGNKVALIFKEPFSKCGLSRYCVWFEPECKSYIRFLTFILTIADYLFYTDNTYTGKEGVDVYYSKKAPAEEISWRPSDTDEAAAENDKVYFKKVVAQKKYGGRLAVFFFIMLFFISAFIFICYRFG